MGDAFPERRPGDVLAKRYRLDHRLGEGGMGEVWAATHEVTRRAVALKLLKRRSADLVARFEREARAASAIHHPNVVDVHDIFELEDGTPVMVLELLDGESFQARLYRDRRLPAGELARILAPVISAVGTAHAAGIIHRDLKPDNIFLGRDGSVKVLDFGIAKLAPGHLVQGDDAGATATGALLGTPYYMSPEQAGGEAVDHRSDIWSLGMIAYQALSGVLPTHAESVGGVIKRVLLARIPPLASQGVPLPDELVALVTRMLAENPDHRPADLREVLAVFQRYAGSASPSFASAEIPLPDAYADTLAHAPTMVDTPPPAPAPPPAPGGSTTAATALPTSVPQPPMARSRLPWLAAGIALLALVGGTAWWMGRGEPAVDEPPAAAAVTDPELGRDALARFHDPQGSKSSRLSSASYWDAVADDFDAAVESGDPQWRAAASFSRGQAALLRGRHDDASKAFAQSLEHDADFAPAHVGMASALSFQADHDGALASARRAQRLEPKWWVPVAMAARIYLRKGDQEEAFASYQSAMSLSDDPTLLAETALAYHSAELDNRAEELAHKALAKDPDLTGVLVLLAERALERSDAAVALKHAEHAVTLAARDTSARLAYADALAISGQKERATTVYRELVALAAKVGEAGLPKGRLALVREALDADKLPPPRGEIATEGRSRPTPKARRSAPKPRPKPRSQPKPGPPPSLPTF